MVNRKFGEFTGVLAIWQVVFTYMKLITSSPFIATRKLRCRESEIICLSITRRVWDLNQNPLTAGPTFWALRLYFFLTHILFTQEYVRDKTAVSVISKD